MPYPSGHRARTRRRIVDSARRLFNRRGFDGVSIKEIMAAAGLTHGGFYKYFKSKSELYAAVLDCFFTDPEWENAWEGVVIDPASGPLAPQIIEAYLSRQHQDEVENACPMAAVPSDVARTDDAARRAYQKAFEAMVAILEGEGGRETALGVAALCIGGMVIARATDDTAFKAELRESVRTLALELGGWAPRAPARLRA